MTTVDLGTLRIGMTTDGVSESVKDIDKAKKAFGNMQKSIGELDKQMELNQANYEAEISYIQSNTTVLNKNWQESKKVTLHRKQLADAVKNQEKKIKELTEGLKILENSEEDNTEAIIDQKTEIAKAVKQLNEYKTELRETANEEITKGFEKIKTGIKAVTTAAVAMGAAIVGALTASAESTREYREDQAKLITAFKEGGFSADEAKKSYADMYAILGEDDRSVEAANHLAELCDTEKELSDWSTICAGVMAKFGDSLPIEGLTEAANETAKVGQVTGPLADALNWAGVSEDLFNESLKACNTEQERSRLITETLLGLYEDAGVQYKDLNKDIIANRDAQRKMQEATAKVGEAIEPVLAQGKQMIAEFLTRLADWVSNNQSKIVGFANKVKDFVNFLIKNRRTVITMVSGVGTAFLAWNIASTVTKVVQSVKAFTTVTKGATVAQGAFNAVASANPYGAIAAVIGLVVGALASFIATSDEAAEATKKLSPEVQALSDRIDEQTEKWDQLKEGWQESREASYAEIIHIQDLREDLFALADATGQVGEKDKARAQFILNELNKALDTEYTMTGLQIDRYGDLCASIDAVMKKKQESIILAQSEEEYAEAYESLPGIEQEITDAYNEITALEEEKANAVAELRKLWEEAKKNGTIDESAEEYESFEKFHTFVLEARKKYNFDLNAYADGMRDIVDDIIQNDIDIEASTTKLNEAAVKKDEALGVMKQYQEDYKLAVAGDTEALIDSYAARSRGLETHVTASKEQLKEQADTYANTYKKILERVKNGEEVDEAIIETARSSAELAMTEYELAGGFVAEGFKDGISRKISGTKDEMKNLANQVLGILNWEFQINSPSKKTAEMGGYLVEGLWEGLNNKTNWLIGQIKTFCQNSLDSIKSFFDIHSPSKKTEEFGHYLVQGLAEGIKDDMSAEEALEQKCKNLTSILKEFTDSFSLDSSIANNELTLWKLQNPNATPDEIAAAEKQILNRQLENQADAIDVTNQAYLKSVELTGENSEESQKLYEQLLKEKIAYEQLKQSIEEVNKTRDESIAKANEEAYKSHKARQEVLKAQADSDRALRKSYTSTQSAPQVSKSAPSTTITQQFYTQTVTPSQIRMATVKAMTGQEVVAAL